MKKLIVLSLITLIAFASCKKDTTNTTTTTPPVTTPAPQLRFVFKFDSTQVRLGDSGQVVNVPANHRAQNPHFNGMSVHHIEMAQTNTTAVGFGAVLYTTPTNTNVPSITVWNTSHTTSQTYTDAIIFSDETIVGNGVQFFSKPLSQITPGTYPYLRVSVAYQNYTINYGVLAGTTASGYTFPSNYYTTGTIASFIGYNTYIDGYTIKTQNVTVNGAKQQGYWGFESSYVAGGVTYTTTVNTGQAPQGATTVVNPLFASSAVPPGSCLVTGEFVASNGTTIKPLTITGNETSDIIVTVSMSTNNSFEWKYNSSNPNDGRIYPLNGDTVVNMGVRGMIPILPN